jgi:hypothetical protein
MKTSEVKQRGRSLTFEELDKKYPSVFIDGKEH